MRQLSLKLRTVLFAITILAVFAPLTVVVLDDAYTDSLTQAKMNELRLMNLGLLSAFELDGDTPYMPEFLYEEQLNLPDSGYLGLIVFRNKVIWQSPSAIEYTLSPPTLQVPVGSEAFDDNFAAPFDNEQYFAYAFTAEFASDTDFEPVRFYIFNNKQRFTEERFAFVSTTWQWMLALSAILLLFIVLGLSLILAPVRALIDEISLTSRGKQKQLNATYPKEFDSLKQSINALLHAEAAQRTRYKNSLGDLAHSLKTPLAVALGTQGMPPQGSESLYQIDSIIRRQLKRASAGSDGWQTPVKVYPIIIKVADAMDKVYQDKQLDIAIEGMENARFHGDKTDLMELCGNVLDNACKAAQKMITVTVTEQDNWLSITVEDDGPGIPDHQKQQLLERGKRLDTYAEGHGIGMALVSDLITAYEGQLLIQDAHNGGAKITLRFPLS